MVYQGDNEHKARAYQVASRAIEELFQKDELEKISGVGSSIAEKIKGYYKTDKISYYEKLKSELPEGAYELLKEPLIGPKKAKALYEEMEIKNIKALKKACEEGKLIEHVGFGEKTQQAILEDLKKQGI